MERYIVLEKNKEGQVVGQIDMHGYDGEDDHIYRFIEECREDGNKNHFGVHVIRVDQI